MKQRVKIIHRQGEVNVLESNELIESAYSTFSNLVKAMKERAKRVWGVRFIEDNDSITAIWPPSDRLSEGWSESVKIIFAEE